jgi:hypothetical protein
MSEVDRPSLFFIDCNAVAPLWDMASSREFSWGSDLNLARI